MTAPIKNKHGYITNAADLRVDDVAHQKVICPLCDFPFKMWPEGWDAHAAHRCEGQLSGDTPEERKKEYKRKLRHLFRP